MKHAFVGIATTVEIEVSLDNRTIAAHKNRPLELPVEVAGAEGAPVAFRRIPTEQLRRLQCTWRVWIAVPLSLPPSGWQVLRIGRNETAKPTGRSAGDPAKGIYGVDMIWGGAYQIEARAGGKMSWRHERERQLSVLSG